MTPLRFLLALPHGAVLSGLPRHVSRPEEAIAGDPTLWIAPGVSSIAVASDAILIGALFSKSSFGSVSDERDIEPVAPDTEQFARHLMSRYWGAYVAIQHDHLRSSIGVFPDPSGLAPVYSMETDTHRLVASDPVLFKATINYQAIAAHLLRPELRCRTTCLVGVEELVPGVLVEFGQTEMRRKVLWEPSTRLPGAQAPGFEEASEHLRALSVSVMTCWAERLGRVGVALSGGVDSSLVAAALAVGGIDFDCVTISTADPSGDERLHAQSVARALDVRCLERTLDAAAFDPSRSASQGLARPARRAFRTTFDDLLDAARTEMAADVIFDGNNGDNLFCYLHSAAPVVDRLRASGPGRATWQTVLDMCHITGCSLSVVLAAALRRIRGAGPKDPWPEDSSLLACDVQEIELDPLTPWLAGWTPRRSGAIDHLRLLMHAQNHLHSVAEDGRRLSPLASQPLVEYCLGVPSWVWSHGGRNRAPARSAFARELPVSVRTRTSKTGPDSFLRIAFARHRPVIRDRLLGGLLATNEILDRSAVASALDVDEVTDLVQIERLMDLLEAENWARSWSR